MDFFDPHCQSGPYTQEAFGVCDDQNGQVAYVDIYTAHAKEKWTATVRNAKQIPVTFTAVDGCVIQAGAEEGRGRCDAMLTTAKSLFLLELKERKGKSDWRKVACDQLESTICFLLEHHPKHLEQFTRKKAQACNRRRSGFVVLEPELKLRFSRYGFRIDTQASVVVVS